MIDTDKFKKMLEEELVTLTAELSRLGRINPDNPADWEPVPDDLNVTGADPNESSDRSEEFEEKSSTLNELEIRFNLVKKALKKIEEGKYGIDEVDGEQIPMDRLEANPAARTKVENAGKLEN